MKLRNGAYRYGADPYYRMIGSVHVGEPVHATDTALDGAARRDVLLRKLDVQQRRKAANDAAKDSTSGD